MKVEPRAMCETLRVAGNWFGLYTVVKELIPEIAEKEHVESMIQSIRGLDQIGITPYDCRPCNFRGSRLVNLGTIEIDPSECSRDRVLSRNIEEVGGSYRE